MRLITTNDNDPAIRFYEHRGMKQVAVHVNAVIESRKLKPEISLLGVGVNREIEFEYRFYRPDRKPSRYRNL
jgi:ribosomal protein S18 acetylase RimI-like enzyme